MSKNISKTQRINYYLMNMKKIKETKKIIDNGKDLYVIDTEFHKEKITNTKFNFTILEVGLSIIKKNGKHEHFHYIVEENKDFYLEDDNFNKKEKFLLNNSEVKTLNEIKKEILNMIDTSSIFIGHGIKRDINILNLPISKKNVLDTTLLYQYMKKFDYNTYQPRNFLNILQEHNIDVEKKHLHNAGNDCYYFTKVFNRILNSEYISKNELVLKIEEKQSIKNKKINHSSIEYS